MAKRTPDEIEKLFKDAFEEQKGERTTGWTIEDSEPIILKLLNSQTDKPGKEVKIQPETLERIKLALLVTPQRITTFLVEEMARLGAVTDETTKKLLARLIDVTGFRQALVSDGILDKTPKGKQKKSITSLLK